MPKEIIGSYRFDRENSAKLMAGALNERYEMLPGFEEAIEAKFLAVNDNEIGNVRLDIMVNCLRLTSDDGDESFPLLRAWEQNGQRYIEVDWDGEPMTLAVNLIPPRSLHLANEGCSLGQFVWMRS